MRIHRYTSLFAAPIRGTLFRTLKKLIPAPIKHLGRHWVLDPVDQWQRDRALVAIVADLQARGIDRAGLTALRQAWGNEGYSADVSYLEQVADQCLATTAPVLECGSGVSTILAGVVARGGVWSLEQEPSWAAHVRQRVERCSLTNTNVLYAPFVNDWYELRGLALPPHIGVILCDGPRGALGNESRYECRGHVVSRITATWDRMLVDDATQSVSVFQRWITEHGCVVQVHETPDGPYAIVTPPAR